MAGPTSKEREMPRSKRRRIRRIVLGLAVAALIPATAQARPLDMSSEDARLIHQAALPRLVGSEDLAFSRSPAERPRVAKADDGKGYDAGVGSLAGLVLILVAAGAAVAVHQTKKAKLAPA
jgi:hypothetical protein